MNLAPFIVTSLMVALTTVATEGQTVTATTGAVNGTVTDSSGAVLPGVTVRLSGPALMTAQAAVTDPAGTFRISAVAPGEYALSFELDGFAPIVREAVRVSLGFTATVDAVLHPGAVTDSIIVTGNPVIDTSSTAVTVHFDSTMLATMPGARDIFAVLANTPGVAMARMDVGGNGALAIQEYTAYGLRATTGMHRNEVEGIRVGGANGANDNYLSDFASFAEIAVEAVGHAAAMPVPGTMARYVSKSGGNSYRGSAYADFQGDGWQTTNIDADQIARGVIGGPGLDAQDVNRLQRFRDINADIGGYLRKSRAWWYAAYRTTEVRQRYAWLLDTAAVLGARVATSKVTYNLSSRQRLVGYLQHQTFQQSSYFLAGTTQAIQTSDALPRLDFPVSVWKGEYSTAISDAIYADVRAGAYLSGANQTFKGMAPRIVDVGANTAQGAFFATKRLISRPQLNGSLSLEKGGLAGNHTFRIGGEYMLDRVDAPHLGYGHPCNCVSTLNNGVPTQVLMLLGNNESGNDLETIGAYVDDTWRLHRRLTLSLGVRLDRYQPILPDQRGPAGQVFAAVDPVLTFNNWGPRVGLSTLLTADGRTAVKLQYGKFWLYPGANFTAAFNPNTFGWSRTYRWNDDANGNGYWDPGEEGALLSAAGGTAATRLDPEIDNSQVHQATAYVERELATDVGVRTGVVVNALRQPYGTINVSRPLDAYSRAVAIADPGPDGRSGTADDGAAVTGYELSPDLLGLPSINLTTNLPGSQSDYYTWEVAATRRHRGRWSLLASYTRTWSREAAIGTGNDFTPNALTNTRGGQNRFTTWQAKLYATVELPHAVRLVPQIRAQSGAAFARTFVQPLNYGTAIIKAEPVAANRTPHIAVVDVRTDKRVTIARAQVFGFLDIYNLLNSNSEQALTTSSGASWLRPTVVTAPRSLRVGARLEW